MVYKSKLQNILIYSGVFVTWGPLCFYLVSFVVQIF